MATRTTELRVRNIIETDLSSDSVNMFIGDASLWVTEALVALDTGLSAERLEIIERYLACAFIRLRDLGLSQASLDDTSETYQVDKTVTDYLRRAAGLDPTGTVQKAFLGTSGATGTSDGGSDTFVAQLRVGAGFRCNP